LGIELGKNWKRPDERSTLARMLEHSTMANVCDTKSKQLNKHFSDRRAPPPSHELTVFKHLNVIAESFVQMYQQRQIADLQQPPKMGPNRRPSKDRFSRGRISKLASDSQRARGPEFSRHPPLEGTEILRKSDGGRSRGRFRLGGRSVVR
jgi:hypothetical protein